MSAKIGALNVDLSLETARFSKGLTEAEAKLAKTTKRFESIGKSMSSVGQKLSLGLTLPMAAFGASAVKAAMESQDALGQVNAALASMGNAAGRSAEQLQGLASGIMRKSLFDDDEVLRKVTANLLTFGNIAGEQFDRAQQAAVDLAARMGTDLQSATILVGKALNDPAKGLSALSRAGVQFTEQQKEQIKAMAATGDAAGAQRLMLAELEKQFKGSAEAARNANPLAAAQMSFAEFQETVGEKLLPILPRITDAITKVLDAFTSLSPGMQTAVIVGGALATALGPVLVVVGNLLPVLVKLGPVLGVVGKAMLFVAANPAILGLAAVVGGIYLAWKNWDKITAIVRNVYVAVKTWLLDKLNAVFEWVGAKIKWVADKFKWLYDVVVGNSYVPDMVTEIGEHMRRLDSVMVDQADSATTATADKFAEMAGKVRSIMARLYPEAERLRQFQDEMGAVREFRGLGGDAAIATAAEQGLQRERIGASVNAGFGGFEAAAAAAERVRERLPDLKVKVSEFGEAAGQAFGVVTDGLKGALLGAQSFGDALRDIVARLADMALDFAFKALGASIGVPGFAGGTNNAPRGLALVGERGPELVQFRGGERVIPNHRLPRMAAPDLIGGAGYGRSHPPITINVNAPMSARDARETGAQIERGMRAERTRLARLGG